VLPSLQVNTIGGIPPTKFRLILPSLAPKQEICLTTGLTAKMGGSARFTVIGFVQLFASVIRIV
jgi:hypothetical protein